MLKAFTNCSDAVAIAKKRGVIVLCCGKTSCSKSFAKKKASANQKTTAAKQKSTPANTTVIQAGSTRHSTGEQTFQTITSKFSTSHRKLFY